MSEEVKEAADANSEEEDEVLANAPPVQLREYRRGRKLGQGATGVVFVCRRQGSRSGFAVKAVDLRRMQLNANAARQRKSLAREVEILKVLPPHPHIVQMVDAFEEQMWFLIIMELVGGGDLFTALTSREPRRFYEREASFVLVQLCEGLSFLHNQKIIHRDMKLDNVLVASERREGQLAFYNVKITDFGLSKNIGEDVSAAVSLVGTRPYTAPEVLAGGTYDFTSDVWCLGVLLYVLLVGQFPFDKIPGTQHEVDLAIGKGVKCSGLARSVVAGFLRIVATQRVSLAKISSSQWVQEKASGDSSERPLKRKLIVMETASSAATKSAVVASSMPPPLPVLRTNPAEAVELPSERINPTLQQACVSSHVREWLPYLLTAGTGGDGADLPCGSSAKSGPLTSAELEKVYLRAPQPDVMQVYLIVPSNLASTLSGKAGVDVKNLGAVLSCAIGLARPSGIGAGLLSIIGEYKQIVLAQEVLAGRLNSIPRGIDRVEYRDVEVILFIRSEAAGVVIGKQGCVIKQIRKRTKAGVQVLTEHLRGHRPCVLTGELQCVLHAERHIFDLVRAVPLPVQVTEVELPPWSPPPDSPFPATPLPSPSQPSPLQSP